MDGPSGTGKSTVSRRLAGACAAAYLDTGAMYRALTLAVLRAGLDGADPAAERIALGAVPNLQSVVDPDAPRILLSGEDVEAEIRGPAVTAAVSAVSAVPAVRAALVARQRTIVADAVVDGGIVVEGRDIGSVVVPDAPLKVYLTASEHVRAARRGAQDRKAGRTGDIAVVLADVRRRDRLDSTRRTSPLQVASDAVVLDTDELSVDDVLAELLRLVRERGLVT
ncbi:(d)CMP kinase [Pseudonocardia xinjiangensis]|uniref:Cytidylate kinase n=1 Tax=Pseudonocardia xinjiangensis TaxID=75289 RepID=A0ABX1RE18_9PSEU|nr:(d)CMP kinase [Pseudonocardia xinjiangensis]NMH78627.1 (d)CMP kinase [Pseudonocardia xinjiangensis]